MQKVGQRRTQNHILCCSQRARQVRNGLGLLRRSTRRASPPNLSRTLVRPRVPAVVEVRILLRIMPLCEVVGRSGPAPRSVQNSRRFAALAFRPAFGVASPCLSVPTVPHQRGNEMSRRQTSPGKGRRAVSQTVLVILIAVATAVIIAGAVVVQTRESNNMPRSAPPSTQTDLMKVDLQSPDAGRRLDAAVALLRAGQLEGGRALLDLAAGQDSTVRAAAAGQWARVGLTLAEAVGCVLEWPAENEAPTPQQLAAARAFWNQRATPRLLADVLDRLESGDWRWTRIETLLARRDWVYEVVGRRFADKL